MIVDSNNTKHATEMIKTMMHPAVPGGGTVEMAWHSEQHTLGAPLG